MKPVVVAVLNLVGAVIRRVSGKALLTFWEKLKVCCLLLTLPLEFPWLVAAPPASYYRALALVQHEDERIGCESGVAALPTVVFAANR